MSNPYALKRTEDGSRESQILPRCLAARLAQEASLEGV